MSLWGSGILNHGSVFRQGRGTENTEKYTEVCQNLTSVRQKLPSMALPLHPGISSALHCTATQTRAGI